jgi:hypothetical protein
MSEPFALRPEGGCLDALTLDRLLAEERDGLESARAHLGTCANCAGRLEALRQEQAVFMTRARVTPAVVAIDERLAARRGSPWAWLLRPWLAWPVASMGAAAVILVLMVRPGPAPAPGEAIRLKGSFELTALRVGEHATAKPLGPTDRLVAGDRIVFAVTTPSPGTVYLFARSGPEALAALGTFAAPGGEPWQLPVSATLDAQPVDERVSAVFCRTPVPAALIEARLREIELHGVTEASFEVEGCAGRSLLLRRAAAPL